MKCRKMSFLCFQIAVACGAILVWSNINHAQAGPFLNLGFEHGITSRVLPYWTCKGYLGNLAGYDTMALDSALVSIHDSDSIFVKPLTGTYSVLLQDGCNSGATELMSAYISQTGDVPSWAKSLWFQSDITPWIDELQVSLNDVVVPFSLYSIDHTVDPRWGPVRTYACDISAFAGQTAMLKFEKLVHDPNDPNSHGIVDLDGIVFSFVVIPEPSTAALLTLAAIACGGFFAFRRLIGWHIE